MERKDVKTPYKALETEFSLLRDLLKARQNAGLTQADIAERMGTEAPRSAEIVKPFLAGRDIKRYQPLIANKHLIFTRRGIEIHKYPAIINYLSNFKQRLLPGPKDWKGGIWQGRKPGAYQWYEIQDTIDYHAEFEKPKIIVPAIVKSASYAFDTEGFYSNDKTCIIPTEDKYLLGLMGSKVVDLFMHSISSTKQGGYFEYKPMYIAKLPIRAIDPNDSADVAFRDKMIEKEVLS